MSASGRRNDAGSDNEEEETSDAKIERLGTEIEELKASLIDVPEASAEWYRIKKDMKDRDDERLVLLEKKRCDDVVKEFFEENPHVLEAVPECPVCLEKMWDGFSHGFSRAARYVCCGKVLCKRCRSLGASALDTCPLCRGEAPDTVNETKSIIKEKADSGITWAQAELGKNYLYGMNGVPEDMEKALQLLSEAAEKGSTEAKHFLGEYYCGIANYEEARRWHEAAAAEGAIMSLCQLGLMTQDELAFDENEESRAEAFRLLTISATLLQDSFKLPSVLLSRFFSGSLPVMLHYLRPAVEEGSAAAEHVDDYALMLYGDAIKYYGIHVVVAPGYSPVPEALFWHRRSTSEKEPAAGHPLVQLERAIREKCAHCLADLPAFKQSCCVECKAAYYCGRDCQIAHWKAGHKKECVKKLKKKLKAAGALVE